MVYDAVVHTYDTIVIFDVATLTVSENKKKKKKLGRKGNCAHFWSMKNTSISFS